MLLTPVTDLGTPIDRHALVSRHDVQLTAYKSGHPMQVGNGEFAFSFDVTGLQTFAPYNTMSQWGWHSGPIPNGERMDNFQGQVWDTHGRGVRYPMPDPQHPALSNWMASNPHRINLGRVGLDLRKRDGSLVLPSDLTNIRQTLDLWGGVATSRFDVEGTPVVVKTTCHAESDTIGVEIQSKLVRSGQLKVFIACPGDNPLGFANFVGDWNSPAKLETSPTTSKNSIELVRKIDGGGHRIGVHWEGKAKLDEAPAPATGLRILRAEYGSGKTWSDVTRLVSQAVKNDRLSLRTGSGWPDPTPGVGKVLRVTGAMGSAVQLFEAQESEDFRISPASFGNRLILTPDVSSDSLAFTATFSQKALPKALPSVAATFASSRRGWSDFWKSGGAIDLSESKDQRWKELERRIVLSQYLMAVNEAGSLPPQESGLVNNGWYGRFHLEMVWWHAAHWALWDRWPKLNPALSIYDKVLPGATSLAKSQGYAGARWPKCVGPDGIEWPHEIHALLIWQQPHPIFFAELAYRANPSRATLEKWAPVVEASADFMASYAFNDPSRGKFVLGPPLVPVSENLDAKTAMNPAFELGYWRFGLRVANEWRKRMGLTPNLKWRSVAANLSPIPQQDGLYVLNEGVQNMWSKYNFEHPALTGTYGMLPGDGVDVAIMKQTLAKVSQVWDFQRTWGWDFPMLAMCAARLGDPDKAVDFLLHPAPGFQFDECGLATGGPFPYFPSNGGLLYAVAMMAAGWDGATKANAPGFPQNGSWKVRWEGLKSAL